MCSNISTETTRSNAGPVAGSKTFMSQVTTFTFVRFRSAARASIVSRWSREFETATMREPG